MRHAFFSLAIVCSVALACCGAAQQVHGDEDAPASQTPVLQDTAQRAEPLASVLDVKSEEDLARVKKLGFEVKIRVVDAADGKPIKGVAFGMWDETAQTDADGIARLVRKVEHGMPVGLDTIVPLEHINRQAGISKDGKEVDVKQIAWPYSVHVSAAEISSGVCVEKTLELVLQGRSDLSPFPVPHSMRGSRWVRFSPILYRSQGQLPKAPQWRLASLRHAALRRVCIQANNGFRLW